MTEGGRGQTRLGWPNKQKRKEHIQMNGNEYDDAYPTKEEFKLDIIQHIAKTHNLELTWELVGALRSAYAEARLK